MTFSDSDSPVIGIEGVRRHRGEKIVVGRGGKRYLGRLWVDDEGPYLGRSSPIDRKILKIQARSDDLYIPVNGRNGLYMRRYYYFQLL